LVVSTSANLTSALNNTALSRIVLASGTYNLIAELSITRSVILEAAVAGSVILNAQASSSSWRRVVNINPGSSGVVQLIGLGITGGYINSVRAHVQRFPSPRWENAFLTYVHFDSHLVYDGCCLELPVWSTCCLRLKSSHRPHGRLTFGSFFCRVAVSGSILALSR
jgi:hypothetical protein